MSNLGFSERLCMMASNLFPRTTSYVGKFGMEYCEEQYKNARRDFELFRPHLDLDGALMLDAGCSHGGKSVYYAENGPAKVIGLERYGDKLEMGRELARKKNVNNVEYVAGDLSDIPFDNDTFDIIFLNDVVEHIPIDILEKALDECQRVIKPTGKICIEFPPWTGPYAAHVYHYIYVPWCHFVFSDETLLNVIAHHQPDTADEFRDFYFELNRLDRKGFVAMVSKLGMDIEHLDTRVPKNINLLKALPGLNDYMALRVKAVLRKGA